MKALAITDEQMQAGRQALGVILYKAGQRITDIPDVDGAVRKLFAAPDSKYKRAFLKFVGRLIKSNRASEATEAAGLYDVSELYAMLCDLSEHIMAEERLLRAGKKRVKKYQRWRRPDVVMASDWARAAASDIVRAVKMVTGIDLMDPAGSLKRKAV